MMGSAVKLEQFFLFSLREVHDQGKRWLSWGIWMLYLSPGSKEMREKLFARGWWMLYGL
jgi:hypothetical protein